MSGWLSDFETEAGTFFAHEVSGSIDDPYDPDDGTTDEYDWVEQATVDVRFEPRGEGYQREDTGAFVRRAPRVFGPPSLLEAYGTDRAEEIEGEAFSRAISKADSPTHRIVTCHHDRLDSGDEGVLRMELEDLSDG